MNTFAGNAGANKSRTGAMSGSADTTLFRAKTLLGMNMHQRHFREMVKSWNFKAGRVHAELVEQLGLKQVDNGAWKPDRHIMKDLKAEAMNTEWGKNGLKPTDLDIARLMAGHLLLRHINPDKTLSKYETMMKKLSKFEGVEKMLSLYVARILYPDKLFRDRSLVFGLRAHQQAHQKYPEVPFDEQATMEVLENMCKKYDQMVAQEAKKESGAVRIHKLEKEASGSGWIPHHA